MATSSNNDTSDIGAVLSASKGTGSGSHRSSQKWCREIIDSGSGDTSHTQPQAQPISSQGLQRTPTYLNHAVRQVVLERVSPMINQLRASSEPPSKERFVQLDRSLRSALIQEADEAIWAADQAVFDELAANAADAGYSCMP
ncbi:hypothetical protein WJX84_002129 [Apatococcus fuscideae]|uniref:Uncharacterized protein n=1 Tax=Apatococcus fuscideae TaxID=2026836 RepID=A0AAW1TF23_9CHLO